MFKKSLNIAVKDIRAAIMRYSLVVMLGWQDVRQRYRRSSLGPFWLTTSTGVMIGTIGVVFSQIFNTLVQEYLTFLAIGIILQDCISSAVMGRCLGFVSAESIIKQLAKALFVHIEKGGLAQHDNTFSQYCYISAGALCNRELFCIDGFASYSWSFSSYH